jgi:hypothetical protein
MAANTLENGKTGNSMEKANTDRPTDQKEMAYGKMENVLNGWMNEQRSNNQSIYKDSIFYLFLNTSFTFNINQYSL